MNDRATCPIEQLSSVKRRFHKYRARWSWYLCPAVVVQILFFFFFFYLFLLVGGSFEWRCLHLEQKGPHCIMMAFWLGIATPPPTERVIPGIYDTSVAIIRTHTPRSLAIRKLCSSGCVNFSFVGKLLVGLACGTSCQLLRIIGKDCAAGCTQHNVEKLYNITDTRVFKRKKDPPNDNYAVGDCV